MLLVFFMALEKTTGFHSLVLQGIIASCFICRERETALEVSSLILGGTTFMTSKT